MSMCLDVTAAVVHTKLQQNGRYLTAQVFSEASMKTQTTPSIS